jgi:NTE family protein
MQTSSRPRIGLALGSGAARGLAHIGVLEVLEAEGIHVDMITGTSIGALAGALYAQGRSAAEIKKIALDLTRTRLVSLMMDVKLSKSGIVQGNRVRKLLKTALGGEPHFNDLKIPFACVATDINTGEEVVISEGSVLEGVRASFSTPALFTLVQINGRYLVDGGLANPVPVSLLKKMGADFIIAISVSPDVKTRTGTTPEINRQPNMVSILLQSLHIATYSLVKSSVKGSDVIIRPQVGEITGSEFHRAEELIARGNLAARNAMGEIRRKLDEKV